VSRINAKHPGFLLTEMLVATAVMGLILTGLALAMNGFARFNRYQLVRQRCTAAAQAQLDNITATGKPIPQDDFQRLWPNLATSVASSPGAGQWEGLMLVEVTTTAKSFRKEVQVRLNRYVPGDSTLKDDSKTNPIAKED
jgi:type II secretory pathway pseudopilin PulG